MSIAKNKSDTISATINEVVAKYEPTIGIECHVQLATDTKLFSPSSNDAREAEPNATTNHIDFGLPGVLPILNKRAVELAAIAGKALNSKIANTSRFDRKHYFYPDLPKGYQTTQMYEPIILGGYVEAPLDDGTLVKVTLHHAHLEDDAGKLTHYGDYSLVDLNRAGTPLIEIVSNPDIHSAAAAKAYASELHRLMVFSGASLGNLYHGNMRFDVNVSVAPKGSKTLGNRAEVKNLNSFKSVEKAAEFEIDRQIKLLENGEKVKQETRGWNEAKQKTISQRSKEDAQDYRYMPDPDNPPIILTDEEILKMQENMPKLPAYYRNKWASLKLDNSVINALLDNKSHAYLVDEVQEKSGDDAATKVAHWLTSALISDSSAIESAEAILPTTSQTIELAEMVSANELSSTSAKDIFNKMGDSKKSARELATELNLIQISDTSAIESIVDEVLAYPASQQSVTDIKEGKEKAIGYLVGQVMKASKGKANPGMAGKMIKEKINEL